MSTKRSFNAVFTGTVDLGLSQSPHKKRRQTVAKQGFVMENKPNEKQSPADIFRNHFKDISNRFFIILIIILMIFFGVIQIGISLAYGNLMEEIFEILQYKPRHVIDTQLTLEGYFNLAKFGIQLQDN